MHNCVTEEDVRMYILDRNIEDNGLDLDLSFSHEEIAEAMRRCAREYNSIPPRVGMVSPENLPNIGKDSDTVSLITQMTDVPFVNEETLGIEDGRLA